MKAIWLWMRRQWRLAHVGGEWKRALHHCEALILSADRQPLQRGVEITLWVFPKDSPYACAGAMLPIEEDGESPRLLRPTIAPETTTVSDSVTSTTVWRFA
jgi:hypothetical protein